VVRYVTSHRYHRIGGDMDLKNVTNATAESALLTNAVLTNAVLTKEFGSDSASAWIDSGGVRFRLPKLDPLYDAQFTAGWARGFREAVTERQLLNCHGTFYEVPRRQHLVHLSEIRHPRRRNHHPHFPIRLPRPLGAGEIQRRHHRHRAVAGGRTRSNRASPKAGPASPVISSMVVMSDGESSSGPAKPHLTDQHEAITRFLRSSAQEKIPR
jgi:hypothetical protein